MKSTKYSYSKVTGMLFTTVSIGIIGFSVPYMIGFINIHDSINWSLILAFDALFLLLIAFVMIKNLIPAMQNKTALEFNGEGIVSDFKNVEVKWKDIQDIELRGGKTSSLYITFKAATNYEDFRISLQLVKGNDEEVYNTVMKYFEKYG